MAGRGGHRRGKRPRGGGAPEPAPAARPSRPLCWNCGKPVAPGLPKCPNCRARQGWRRWVFGAPGGVVAIALGSSAIWGSYSIIHKFTAAHVTVELTTCHSDEIVLAVANSGGRPVTLGRPEITLISPLADPGPLRMEGFLQEGADPFRGHADLAGDEHDVISYDHPVAPFFGPDDLRAGSCRISVRMAVTPEEGRASHPPATHSCACGA